MLDVLFPLPLQNLRPKPSQIVFDRNGRILRVFLAPDDMWRIPVELDSISPALKRAVLAHEDKYFYYHFGINPVSVIRAMIADMSAGRFAQGASTITMQVARMIEPRERTLGGKMVEAFRSLQLELKYSKDDILAFYFNLAPYGGNIVGVGAASYLYFNKSAIQLSIGDAALLAAIPESPNRLRPDLRHDSALKARDRILCELVAEGIISPDQKAEALSEPIPTELCSLPFEIPHLSTSLARTCRRSDRITTTIDADVQRLAEEMLIKELVPLRSQGISNGSVVVIDNKSCDVLALVGSGNFFDKASHGEVNGALSRRSPGSALKPFAYALALSRGLISPLSILGDVPVNYCGYSPKNYDGKCLGAVTAKDALTRSLNIPAVNLSAALGENGVYEFMRRAGVSTLPHPKEYYGLPLILGGCEVTLLELTSMYSGFANLGDFRGFRLVTTDQLPAERRLLSAEACYIVSEMLAGRNRPDLPVSRELAADIPKVAWKTGTSYGRRDAWSIGYTPRFTVGVWVGNFNGRGVPELVGSDAAAPALFGIISALEENTNGAWFVEPPGVDHRQVCSVSGMPLSEYCASARDEPCIPGVSPSSRCDTHQMITVDKRTGYVLCRHCRTGHDCDERIVEQWPVEMATWMQRNGYPVDRIPEHNPRCPKVMAGCAPLINSPQANCVYKLRRGVETDYQKILLDASASNRAGKVFWFLDGELVHCGASTQRVFIEPKLGVHFVVCTDDEGRSSEVRFSVK